MALLQQNPELGVWIKSPFDVLHFHSLVDCYKWTAITNQFWVLEPDRLGNFSEGYIFAC